MTSRERFGPSKESISAARRFVTRIISDAPVEARESVAVMVSELSTNALVHAASGFDVVVDRSGETVLVAVTDWGGGAPELRSPKSTEPHGRGLRIVEALSDEWGIVSTSGGVKKTIWFRLYLRSSETDADAASAEITATAEQTGTTTGRHDQSPPPEKRETVSRRQRSAPSGAADPVPGRCLQQRSGSPRPRRSYAERSSITRGFCPRRTSSSTR
jgi:anti-sigma regulatory factor (Ser/Thr protein kinase)